MPEQGTIAKAIVRQVAKSDFLFWLAITLARDKMVRAILGTDQAVVAGATVSERRRAYQMLFNVLPISQRANGLLNDARIASTPQSIAFDQIKAPELVISLEDDFYRTFAAACFIASKVPGARLITYATGGHIWVGHDEELFAEVDAFIRRN